MPRKSKAEAIATAANLLPVGLGANLPGLLDCQRCPRLATYRSTLPPKGGRSRGDYWGKPVPGFGDPQARLFLVGLAPGAHGANRTGRPFTGDGAGDFMYPLLHQAGFANQAESVDLQDGFALHDLYISNAVKCVPPENKPRPEEFTACLPYLEQELNSLPDLEVVLALGQNAFRSYLQLLKQQGIISRFADHPFGHGRIYRFDSGPRLVASYHTSRYNLQTGRINAEMFLDLLADIRSLLDGENG